jgi:transposase InsO family protein
MICSANTEVGRELGSADVIDTLADLFIARGAPAHIRSDQGPEFVATAVKGWITGVGAKTAYIEKASPWENGCVESFNGKLRDELLNTETFNTRAEARGGARADRAVASSLQHHTASFRPGLSPTCTGGGHGPDAAQAPRAAQVTSATPSHAPLTSRSDHVMEAGQSWYEVCDDRHFRQDHNTRSCASVVQ